MAGKSGRPDRILKVEFAIPPDQQASLKVRPFVAAASWVNIELLKDGQVIQSEHLEEPTTVYVREQFPQGSPYLISGHTFGAGRNEGLSVNIDGVIDPAQTENHHFHNGTWIGGGIIICPCRSRRPSGGAVYCSN